VIGIWILAIAPPPNTLCPWVTTYPSDSFMKAASESNRSSNSSPLNMPLLLFSLFLTALPSCTLSTNCICTEGPNKGSIVKAKFFYAGTGSGKIEAVAPWGETATGRYLTQTGGMQTKAWEASEVASGGVTHAEGESAVIHAGGSTQVGTATLIGNQGTTWDIIYWGSTLSPTHGQGKGKDTRGNRYRLVW